MKQPTNNYLNNRVLKVNVGFLLSQGSGYIRDFNFDMPAVRVADDLQLKYVNGTLRVSRTKEGILALGTLHVGVEIECSRCLDLIPEDVPVEIEELYAYPATYDTEFSIGEDGNLDLSPLIRAEVLIVTTNPLLCRPDCKGLCAECGANLNYEVCQCNLDAIDPRMAVLKKLLENKT